MTGPQGSYRRLHLLGRGGMSEVWLAEAVSGPLAPGRVVLKHLLPALESQRSTVARFLTEARLGALIDHPRVVRTHDVFRSAGGYFLVQTWVDGPPLERLLARTRRSGGFLPGPAVVSVMLDLLDVLEFLHDPDIQPGVVVHRDIHARNILAGPDGRIAVTDLGIAGPPGPPPTRGALEGTPRAMAPEQAQGRFAGPSADLFAAGVLLWELLAGRGPFDRATPFETLRAVCVEPAPFVTDLRPGLAPAWNRLLVRALAKEPERRFGSASEWRQSLIRTAAVQGWAADPQGIRALLQAGRTIDRPPPSGAPPRKKDPAVE